VRVVNAIHITYVGLCSMLVLLSSLLRLFGWLPISNRTGILYVVHYCLGILGMLIVVTYFLKSRCFVWLLLFWWIPQLLHITIATNTPTYPANVMTPIYLVSMGLNISIDFWNELGPDKFRLIRFNVIAIIGLVLTFLSMLRKQDMAISMYESAVESSGQIIKRSRLAVSSLILGILALPLFGLTSVPCLICGHMACRRIKKANITGKGLAVAGLIMGYLGIVLFTATTYISSLREVYTPYTLPSGKVIKLMGMQRWTEVGEEDSLVLLYQTDIALDSKDELRKEAEYIWQYFRVNVEREGMTKARILAHGPTKGRFIRKRRGYGFEIVKQEDGSWKFTELKDN